MAVCGGGFRSGRFVASCLPRLWARGGLIGRYYRTPGPGGAEKAPKGFRLKRAGPRLPEPGVAPDGPPASGPGLVRVHAGAALTWSPWRLRGRVRVLLALYTVLPVFPSVQRLRQVLGSC